MILIHKNLNEMYRERYINHFAVKNLVNSLKIDNEIQLGL